MLDSESLRLPSRAISPAAMASLASKDQEFVVVEGISHLSHFDPKNLSKQQVFPYGEYLTSRILERMLFGEKLSRESPEVIELFNYLEGLIGFSKESNECFEEIIEKKFGSESRVKECLKSKLSWKEQIIAHAFAAQLGRGIDQFFDDDHINNFIRAPDDYLDGLLESDLKKLAERVLLKLYPPKLPQFLADKVGISNPPGELSFTEIVSWENIQNLGFLQVIDYGSENFPETLLKYVVFGMIYGNFDQQISGRMAEYELDGMEIAKKLSALRDKICEGGEENPIYLHCQRITNDYLAMVTQHFLPKVDQQSPRSVEAFLPVIMRVLAKSHFYGGIGELWKHSQKKDKDILLLMAMIEQEAYYSKASITCILDSLSDDRYKIGKKIEDCLNETLQISEKIGVYFANHVASLGLNNFMKGPLGQSLIHLESSPEIAQKIANLNEENWMEIAMDFLFPKETDNLLEWAMNASIRKSFDLLDSETKRLFLTKYFPLGLAYGDLEEELNSFLSKFISARKRDWGESDDPILLTAYLAVLNAVDAEFSDKAQALCQLIRVCAEKGEVIF